MADERQSVVKYRKIANFITMPLWNHNVVIAAQWCYSITSLKVPFYQQHFLSKNFVVLQCLNQRHQVDKAQTHTVSGAQPALYFGGAQFSWNFIR